MDISRAPFTRSQATAAGIEPGHLRSPRFRRLLRGVYIASDVSCDLSVWIAAALLVLPPDAVVSHTTAMRWYGFDPPGRHGLEFSTNLGLRTRVPGVILHRRRGTLHPREHCGAWVTGPDRTFVDVALRVDLPTLVSFGDHLVHRQLTQPAAIADYATERHLDGVRRARRLVKLVRDGAESPRESVVRLMLRFARLPEPELNVDISDAHGNFIARGDLVYRLWRVVVEYDGLHHLRDTAQWQRDLRRRELLEAAGWRVIVVTMNDFAVPASIPSRVHRALAAAGYRGPAPVLSWQWTRWFGPRQPQDVVTFGSKSA